MKQIVIPIDGQNSTIDSIQNFVIVGANGSGKSHLGAWIETNNKDVLRISAQRALSVPDVITFKSEENAWNKILYGTETEHDKGYKWNWGKRYTTQLVDEIMIVYFLQYSQDKIKKMHVMSKTVRIEKSVMRRRLSFH